MTLEGYKEYFNGACYSLEGFAIGATSVTDSFELKASADVYLEARANFEHVLELNDIEVG